MKANIVELNKSIYDINAIRQSIKDYESVSEVFLEVKDSCYFLSFKAKEGIDLELLMDEFCNYLLGMMKNRL